MTLAIDRLGMYTRAPEKLTITVKRICIPSTIPTWPPMSTMSPTSRRSEKTTVRPVITSWTTPWDPKLTASPITEALAR